MAKKKKKRKMPRDPNMVALINRSGGKGCHQNKRYKPRSSQKIAFKKSLMGNQNPHGAFFMPFDI